MSELKLIIDGKEIIIPLDADTASKLKNIFNTNSLSLLQKTMLDALKEIEPKNFLIKK